LQTNPVPLRLIVAPIIYPGVNEYEVDEWLAGKIDFHVYEELSRKIRGTSRRIARYSIPVGSVDTDEIAQLRSHTSKLVSKKVRGFLFKGSIANLEQLISDSLRRVWQKESSGGR